MQELTVPQKYDNKKITVFLLDTFNNLKQSTLQKSLRQKDIRINNIRTNSNAVIRTGDIIKVFISDELLLGTTNITIVFEDENILVVNKPSGIEVVGNNSLTSMVQKNIPSAQPCHRLDRNTSGLVLYAKNDIALNILLDKFKNHEIQKFYKCEVWGIPNKQHSILKSYLFKDSSKSQVYISDTNKKGYREIITEYSVISSNIQANTSVLDVILHTGRTHQIRAHLAHI